MAFEIPDAGLQLVESTPKGMASLPAQAFAITLNDSVIEDMIEALSKGQDIKLSLGSNPTFLYGTDSYEIPRESDPSPYDLFFTDPTKSPKTAERLPNPAMSLFRKPELNKIWLPPKKTAKAPGSSAAKEGKEGKEGKAAASSKNGAGTARKADNILDDDVQQLGNSLALKEAEKPAYADPDADMLGARANSPTSTTVLDGPGPAKGKRAGGAMKKALSSSKGTSYNNSMPGSPALSAVGSPSMGPTVSASQQAAEKAKQLRLPIIHELAFKEQTYDNLWNKYPPGPTEDEFKVALEKVADLDRETQNYVLKKKYWKELDVFNHEYASDEERQQAIENAVKQYDKMRLTASEPEWDRLLPFAERGKGKCLSKFQANIAKGSSQPAAAPAPKIKVHRAEDSGPDSVSSRDDRSEKKTAQGGESTTASPASQPAAKPAKKASARAAQEKRLLSKTTKKAPSAPKVSPTKAARATKAGAASDEKAVKYKSKEFISDSDSSGDESAPLSSTVTQSKTAKKPVERPVKEQVAAKAKPKVTKPKPAAKESIKPQITAHPFQKRPREDDDSSSSSGTPLSKRVKTRELKPALVQVQVQSKVQAPTVKRRGSSDASPNSHDTGSGFSQPKSKNTSPAKSSPLASSPPTNASDLDPAEEHAHISSVSTKKRKLDRGGGGDMGSAKRQRLSQDIINKALKFKLYYEKYVSLHLEMSALDNPPKERVDDLREMRDRLESMKSEIYRETEAVR